MHINFNISTDICNNFQSCSIVEQSYSVATPIASLLHNQWSIPKYQYTYITTLTFEPLVDLEGKGDTWSEVGIGCTSRIGLNQ